MKGHFSAIIQPFSHCNILCKYCYLGEEKEKRFMSIDTALLAMKRILQYNGKERPTEFIWHGGEPFLIGKDFFQSVVDIQKSEFENFEIVNSIQTNGTLLNENWIDFLIENNFHVGISIDGPEEIHNSNRVFKNGEGSFEIIYNNIKKAIEKDLKIGALCVLTQNSLGKEKEIYQFFKSLSLHFDFSPVTTKNKAIQITPYEWANSAKRFFTLWYNDVEQNITVGPLNALVMMALLEGLTGECNFTGNCFQDYISIDPDGNLFPCNRFAGKYEFIYGNIKSENIQEILTKSKLSNYLMKRTKNLFQICSKCPINKFCNGGCPHQALELNGSYYSPDYFCPGYQVLFTYVIDEVNKQLDNATINNFSN